LVRANVMGKLEHHLVGHGRWPMVVIDDFYSEPRSLVDRAGALSDFGSNARDYYPGVKRPVDHGLYAKNIRKYSEALSLSFGKVSDLIDSTYAIANRKPAELLPIQCIPHYDTADQNQLALVHYLCDRKCGGTAFYRHRSTKIERVSTRNEALFQQALGREATTHGLPAADYVDGDTNLFEKIASVDALFNRAIIYPASLLHSGAIQPLARSSHAVATMRLTITAHFEMLSVS